MVLLWPEVVRDFEGFLTKEGLMFQQRLEDQAAYGNKLLQYGNADILVRIVSDRDIWYIEVAEANTQPNEWYDAAIVRDLLIGSGEDVLSFTEQMDFIRTNWEAIVQCFGLTRREESHNQLATLRTERVRRRIPGLL